MALPPILYDQDGLIVVNKPPGITSTGRTLADPNCLQGQLMAHYRRKIWAVHQLDRGTSGVNVFVRRKGLVQEISEALRRGGKSYLAICHGVTPFERETLKTRIGFDPRSRKRGVYAQGKEAISHVTTLARGESASLIQVDIETGRTHQIRIHSAHLGHPLVGEDRYREPPCSEAPYPLLHAHRVCLKRADAPTLVFIAPSPMAFRKASNHRQLSHPLLDLP